MPRPRTGEKDRALVEAAIQLFLERGVRGTTVKDIAELANVSVGTVYVYHKDKPAIVRRVAYAFAEKHRAFARSVLVLPQEPIEKLKAYILGLYDMWQPFGENARGPIELAEAVLTAAPETPGIAEAELLETVEQILIEAKQAGLKVEHPQQEAQWIALATASFFPLAGSPMVRPFSHPLSRNELSGLLDWICSKLS